MSGQRRVSPDSTESGGLLRHNIRLTRDCNWNCGGFCKVGKWLPEGQRDVADIEAAETPGGGLPKPPRKDSAEWLD